MEQESFLSEIQKKIQNLTGKNISLDLVSDEQWFLELEFQDDNIVIRVGDGILQYPGFARMVVEYSVAVIRKGSLLSQLEFNLILQRN